MALSTFWRGVIAVGSALGVGALIAVLGKKRGLPAAPSSLASPIDEENCSRKFFPSPNRGWGGNPDFIRPMPPKWIVLHDTESPEGGVTAQANASYFSNSAAKVSAHIVTDDLGECYRCVADDQIAWTANGANPDSLNIEMATPVGAALTWSSEDWLARAKLLEISAAHVALWVGLYDIPTKFVDAEGLKNGERGITTHAEVTKAGMGGDHIDPGPDFPIDDFIDMVRGRGGLFA